MSKTTLTVVVNRLQAAAARRYEAEGYDSGFDGGEFSGPAHRRAGVNEFIQIITECGWEPTEVEEEMINRTSERWVYTYFLGLEFLDEAIDKELMYKGEY